MPEIIHCVGVVCFQGEDVLLIQRGKAPRKGEWSIPGGRIEAGESEEAAALRELYEETGITAELIEKIAVIETEFDGIAYQLHDYAALWQSGSPRAGDDADAARFVPPDGIAALGLWDETTAIIKRARTLCKKS